MRVRVRRIDEILSNLKISKVDFVKLDANLVALPVECEEEFLSLLGQS